MGEICNDNRFEIIEAAKKEICAATNIESSPDEMKVIDSILFRLWQMGWLKKYDDSKPVTHADRIRAMSDEELAEFIRDVSYECQDAYWGSKCLSCDFPWCSSDCTLAWLQQPAEDAPSP